MVHKGKHEFESQELGHLALGQSGFHVLFGGIVPNSSVEFIASNYGIEYWCELKAVNEDAIIKARKITLGDDVVDQITKEHSGNNPSPILPAVGFEYDDTEHDLRTFLTLGIGGSLLGAFDKVDVGPDSYILAYIGKVGNK